MPNAVQDQRQLQKQNVNVDIPYIQNKILGINKDDDFHQEVLDSQLETEDQCANEFQILLGGNSVLSQQDQLFSPASSTTRSLDGVTVDFSREDGMLTTNTSNLFQRLVAEARGFII